MRDILFTILSIIIGCTIFYTFDFDKFNIVTIIYSLIGFVFIILVAYKFILALHEHKKILESEYDDNKDEI